MIFKASSVQVGNFVEQKRKRKGPCNKLIHVGDSNKDLIELRANKYFSSEWKMSSVYFVSFVH